MDLTSPPDDAALLRRDASAGDGSLGRLGTWRLRRVIGQGATGVVYLAEGGAGEAEGGERGPVAVKVIHPHLAADPQFRERLLREADAGRRVHHDNVVRTLHVGTGSVEGGAVPYLVMEYVEGRTLRDLLREWGAVPEPLLREVMRQMAAGLAAIHKAGLVHHDVKPENVILTEDDRVRIMDLGVARLAREIRTSSQEGRFAGTLLYAAPERFGRDPVGPPADLYALGVLGYELATGTNPFHRVDAGAVMRAHLEWAPPPAALLDPRVSPFLSEVLGTLLAKRPEDRFPSAAALGAVLADAERGAWWRAREPRAVARGARLPTVPVAREILLKGRVGELDVLCAAWREARAGAGNAVLLEGEPGIGKTRLVDAFLREAGPAAAHVLYGSYAPTGGRGAISDAITDHLGDGHLVERLGRYLPEMAGVVAAYAGVLRETAPPSGAESPSTESLHAATIRLLHALAEEGPVLWVVEDLHFATADSAALVLSLVRAVEGRRVLLLLSTSPRDEGVEGGDFRSVVAVRTLRLRRLGRGDVISMLREVLRSDALAEQLGGPIAQMSGGIPALVLEVVRALRESGAVVQQADGSWIAPRPIDRIAVPPAATEQIASRLGSLSQPEHDLLACAAVAGVVFRPGRVAEVLGRPVLGVLDDLAHLEKKHGLVRARRDTCRFDPPLVREVLYEGLGEGERKAHHAAFADLLEAAAGADVTEVVEHALAARRDPVVRRLIPGALAQLAATHRHDRAAALAGRALREPGVLGGELRVEVLLRRAESLRTLGRREEAQATLGEAVARSDALGSPRCRVLARTQMGAQGYALGAYPPARRVLAEAISIAREAGEPLLEAAAAAEQGAVLRNLGRLEEAEEHLERALRLAQGAGDRRVEARALGNLGVVHLHRARHAEAEELLTREAALAREIADDRLEACAHMNLTAVARETGRLEDARTHAARHLALALRVGDRRLEAAATRNLGDVLRELGRGEEAEGQYRRSLALSRETGEASSEAHTRLCLALLALAKGHLGEACAEAQRSVALSREVGFPRGEASAARVLGAVHRLLGSREEALEALARALELARRLEDRPLEAQVLFALGDVESDQVHHDRGLDRAEEALAMRRRLGAPGPVVRSLVQVSRLRALAGDDVRARTASLEALALARENHLVEAALAAAHALAVGGCPASEARDLLRAQAGRLDASDRLGAWFALGRASGEVSDLAEARSLLEVLVEHVAPEWRTAVRGDVPLHKAVLASLSPPA